MRPGGLPLPAAAPGSAIALRPYYEAFLAESDELRGAEIPVEQVKGPVLLVSGGADAMWPATDMAMIAQRRAAARGFPHQLTHLRYPDAGHLCGGVPGTPAATEIRHPLTGQLYALGGQRTRPRRVLAAGSPAAAQRRSDLST